MSKPSTNFARASSSFDHGLLAEVLRLADGVVDAAVGAERLAQLVLKTRHEADGDAVEIAVVACIDRDDLLLEGPRLVLRLVERRNHAGTASECLLRGRIELRAELGERLELAELRQVEAQAACDLLHRLGLRVTTDAGDGRPDVDGRLDARVEELRAEEDLAVRDRDHVRRDVGGDVARLRLDDRKRRERSAAQRVVEPAGALEESRVEEEHVTREGLTARRAAQQQRELPVRVGVLREVVVDDERVLAAVEEVLAHRGAGERRHPLDRRCLLCGSGDDDRVVHCALVAELLVHLRNRRGLLADCNVDADDVAALLVDDRVDRDGRLARAAVADDQLPLAAADRDHRVDRLETRLERLRHGLPLDHARSLELEGSPLGGLDRTLAVERVPERVDDAAEHSLADRDAHDLSGATDGLALLDELPLPEERNADVVLFQVERDADNAVLELEALERDAVLEAVDARNAVADLQHGADLGQVRLDVVLLDPGLEDRGDLFGP